MNPALTDIFSKTRAIDKSKISDSAGLTPTPWTSDLYDEYRNKAKVLTPPTRETLRNLAKNFLDTLVQPTGSLSEVITNMVYCLRDPQSEDGTYTFVLKGMFGSGSNITDPGEQKKISDIRKDYKTVKLADSSDQSSYKKLHPQTDETISSADEMEVCMKNCGPC